jgi:transaldolase
MYLPKIEFSLWADFIEREFIDTGLKRLIEEGVVNGATSNPAIFKNAILKSPAYRQQLETLKNHDPKAKYEAVAVYDIQKAADALRPLFDKGDDGYVSIEVDPHLCFDAVGTIEEGRRLHRSIGRPNVMIKVPATDAGYEAMEALTAEGIPVNATLVFSKDQALAAANSFARGREKGSVHVDTVISIFVSRLDRAIDADLEAKGVQPALCGVYNASDIYAAVEAMEVPRCRVLFASTGVKSGGMRPSYYVDELLAAHSVNTAPIETIEAFVSHGDTQPKLPLDEARIQAHFEAVAAAGIEMEAVFARLMEEGLDAFKTAFDEILATLE